MAWKYSPPSPFLNFLISSVASQPKNAAAMSSKKKKKILFFQSVFLSGGARLPPTVRGMSPRSWTIRESSGNPVPRHI